MRKLIADLVESILPEAPNAGPPTPKVLSLKWPREVSYRLPRVVQDVGNLYGEARNKVVRFIRGY